MTLILLAFLFINMQNGLTVLHRAAKSGLSSFVSLLLSNPRIDVNAECRVSVRSVNERPVRDAVRPSAPIPLSDPYHSSSQPKEIRVTLFEYTFELSFSPQAILRLPTHPPSPLNVLDVSPPLMLYHAVSVGWK